MLDELSVCIVLCISLVVELQHVEVDDISNCLVNSYVSTIRIVLALEIGGLRTMGDDVIRNNFPQSNCEVDQPLLSFSSFHSIVVFPINVSSIKVVLQNEVTKGSSASHRILIKSCGEFSCSKSTDEYFDSSLIVCFLDSSLNLLISFTERILIPKIHRNILPGKSDVHGPSLAPPECKDDIVVFMRRCITWYSQTSSDAHAIP